MKQIDRGLLTFLVLTILLTLAAILPGSAQSAAQGTPTPFVPAPDAPIRMGLANDLDFPYLITASGTLLQPDAESVWHPFGPDAPVRDVDVDEVTHTLWAATDEGVYAYRDGAWERVDESPSMRLSNTHGYLFALGESGIARGPEHWRMLDLPDPDQPAVELVMLGNHSHVLQNGDQAFLTPDVGLSWEALDAPRPIDGIGVGMGGILLAATDEGVLSWHWAEREWQAILPLPEGRRIDALQTFSARLYALARGMLYVQAGSDWAEVTLPDSDGAHLTAIGVQYRRGLWILDSAGARLWFTADGGTWTMTAVEIEGR